MATSGDFLADRRYGFAEAALAEGDAVAAADLAGQTLEIAPAFTAAWFLLGRAEARAGRLDAAIVAFRRARDLDPSDVLGAGLQLALLGAAEPGEAMSPGYVRALFDEYATRFDRHLTRSLGYRAPELLHDAVRRVLSREPRDFRFRCVLDLGCGTGLAGEAFRPNAARLVGIDLSPAMVRKAEEKRIYDALHVADLLDWLREAGPGSADLVVAADV
ncbi:MAG: methyltransferase domain-containing protein, partial [Methylobacteriaceae bacterium]|nr:methyltransferase domain-containing protein [Methylobacteriaceae bacterium]